MFTCSNFSGNNTSVFNKIRLYCALLVFYVQRVILGPESVSNAVLKVDKSLVVYPQQVPAVKVVVSLHKHVVQHLPLCLLLVLGITDERSSCADLCHQ